MKSAKAKVIQSKPKAVSSKVKAAAKSIPIQQMPCQKVKYSKLVTKKAKQKLTLAVHKNILVNICCYMADNVKYEFFFKPFMTFKQLAKVFL